MNSPDYLEKAGELVASVYNEIETELLNYLVGRMIAGDISNQRSLTAIYTLAQSARLPLMHLINVHEGEIDAAVKKEITDALQRSDKDDLRRIKRGLGIELPEIKTRTIAATVAGVKDILARENLQMVDGAQDAFIKWSSWAITQVNTGNMTTEKALHKAVRELEKQGISTVTYQNAKTGVRTVTNRVDVAVRRHIRTQILQEGMRLTETRLDQAGVQFVEVSSHTGARPSHAKWQGRVYSRYGDREVDGVLYRDFKRECNWGDVADGIGGANCRHSYAAWFPGMARTYEPDPQHPSGESNEKIYELTQQQRHLERQIRDTKRELAGAEQLYSKSKGVNDLGEVSRLKLKLKNQQAAMRELIADNDKVLQRSPRREWAGDMPKVKIPASSGRKLDDFLESKAVKNSGLSRNRVRQAIADELRAKGAEPKDFAALTRAEQQTLWQQVKTRLSGKVNTAGVSKPSPTIKERVVSALQDKGLTSEQIDEVSAIVNKCKNLEARDAMIDALPELEFDSITARNSQAYYSHRSKKITLNIKETADGFKARKDKAPYQTLFHEAGHFIDDRINGYSGYTFASDSAGLGETATKEIRNLLNGIKKRDGVLISEAKEILEKEVRNIYKTKPETIGGLSDIIHGATKGTCCTWGLPAHTKSYWKTKGNLATETFAHFFECSVANPEALETLKKYLPETYNAFLDVIKRSKP